jgi:hypothetical protein
MAVGWQYILYLPTYIIEFPIYICMICVRENWCRANSTAIFEFRVTTMLARAVVQSVKRLPALLNSTITPYLYPFATRTNLAMISKALYFSEVVFKIKANV